MNTVREIDPNAFVIINEAREVMGQGFKSLPAPPPQAGVSLPDALRRVRRVRPHKRS